MKQLAFFICKIERINLGLEVINQKS